MVKVASVSVLLFWRLGLVNRNAEKDTENVFFIARV